MDRHASPVSHSERLDPAPPAHRKAAAGRRPVENSGKAHDALPPLASSHVKYIRGSSSSPCRDAGNRIPRAATSTALQWVQASRSRGGSGQQDSSNGPMTARRDAGKF
ncbi:hypothetical protein DIPPA_33941 [Diplonema papillatum]|nr:hypothetical protein DIPPA_33941 [Diplonema papillatum]